MDAGSVGQPFVREAAIVVEGSIFLGGVKLLLPVGDAGTIGTQTFYIPKENNSLPLRYDLWLYKTKHY